MTVKEAYEKYRIAANDLVKCLADKPLKDITREDIVVCHMIWNTGEMVYHWLKEKGYMK